MKEDVQEILQQIVKVTKEMDKELYDKSFEEFKKKDVLKDLVKEGQVERYEKEITDSIFAWIMDTAHVSKTKPSTVARYFYFLTLLNKGTEAALEFARAEMPYFTKDELARITQIANKVELSF